MHENNVPMNSKYLQEAVTAQLTKKCEANFAGQMPYTDTTVIG